MPKVNCSVIGCVNSTYKINKCKKETCAEHNLEAEGNYKKKVYYLECKPPFHLHTFPGPIKCQQLREEWIKAVRREHLTKKDLANPLQVIESVPFMLLMDWQLTKIPYQPFTFVMKVKNKKIKKAIT